MNGKANMSQQRLQEVEKWRRENTERKPQVPIHFIILGFWSLYFSVSLDLPLWLLVTAHINYTVSAYKQEQNDKVKIARAYSKHTEVDEVISIDLVGFWPEHWNQLLGCTDASYENNGGKKEQDNTDQQLSIYTIEQPSYADLINGNWRLETKPGSPLCSLTCWDLATFINASKLFFVCSRQQKHKYFLKFKSFLSNKVSILKLLCFPFLYKRSLGRDFIREYSDTGQGVSKLND